MNNIYNAIQNLYNMDKTTWQEVLSELYNLVANIENKFDLFELKFGSLLGEQIIKELKKMYDDGSLDSLINDVLLKDINKKVDTFKTEVSEQVDTFKTEFSEQLDIKANNSKVNDLQGQINNLVLGAVGDGNNAEVVQARGNYTLLNDRLNVIESEYKKIDFGYIDLSNSDFVNSGPNRIVTNGIPITEKGIVVVNYVPKQDHVYIQHLRYNEKHQKFTIIENMRVNCRKDVINKTVCNFNVDTSGNDYIAIEGIGFTTNDKSIGYMFLQGSFFGQNTGITEYNTPLNKVYTASFGYYITVNRLDIDDIKKDVDNLQFELNNLKTKCTKYDNFDFTWKTMDKSYFAITIDDSNEYLGGFYDVAHRKNVPISTACVHTRLNNLEKGGTRTIREINNLIVADGGEILAHYAGSPNENTSYEEWLTYTRDVKKALTKEGWIIRGLIRADHTQANTKKAERICRQYFDYADTMGTSNQYNLGLRKFLLGVKTLNDFKTWVDTCCQNPGFYVICVHGGRTDEPLATNDNLGLIIDYINSKSNATFSTYSEVFDKFGCTTVEKKIESL